MCEILCHAAVDYLLHLPDLNTGELFHFTEADNRVYPPPHRAAQL